MNALPPAEPVVRVLGLHARHGRGPLVLEDFHLGVPRGEVLGLFGPNGCGKSTLMALLAGVLRPEKGRVCYCRGWPTARDGQGRVPLACLFQDYRSSLLPWQTVRENLLLPATLAREPREEALDRARGLLDHFGIELPLDRHPHRLSGGQQQVLALLRTLMSRPRLLLLDEPFAALDHHVTLRVRDRLLEWIATEGATVLVSAHDLDDLIYLSDGLLVLGGPPLHIRESLDVDVPRPRRPEMVLEREFLEVKRAVLSVERARSAGGVR